MAVTTLNTEFKEFLRLLNSNSVRYLLVGGYAVNFYGYARATGGLDIWVSRDPENALRADRAIRDFGFDFDEVSPGLLQTEHRSVRMGIEPVRIEVLTSLSGVEFEECYAVRTPVEIGGVTVPVIHFADLIRNKRSAARLKDLADIDNLPPPALRRVALAQ